VESVSLLLGVLLIAHFLLNLPFLSFSALLVFSCTWTEGKKRLDLLLSENNIATIMVQSAVLRMNMDSVLKLENFVLPAVGGDFVGKRIRPVVVRLATLLVVLPRCLALLSEPLKL